MKQVCRLCSEVRWHTECEFVDIVNMAMHPAKGLRKLPRSRWRRALLALRGYELYGR